MKAVVPVLAAVLSASAAPAATKVLVSCTKGNEIRSYRIDPVAGKLVALGSVEAESPKMQWKHPRLPLVFVVLGGDRVGTYAIVGEVPVLESEAATAGPGSYLCTDPGAKFLFSASYRDGSVAVYPLQKDGRVGKALQVLAQPVKSHCILPDPGGKFYFVPHTSPINRIDQFRFDAAKKKLVPNDPAHTSYPENTGPRHLAITMDGRFAYSSNEQDLSATVHRLDEKTGLLEPLQTVPTIDVDKTQVRMSCSDVELSPDGRFLYVGNREKGGGRSSITCFAVDPESGSLTFASRTPTGAVPRSFNITTGGRFLVAAGQGDDSLALFAIDGMTGGLKELDRIQTGASPGWVLAVTEIRSGIHRPGAPASAHGHRP